MFDIFYYGNNPFLFPHAKFASSLAEARKKSRTKFFWYVNGNNDLREFDFTWLPPKWEEHQTHIFLLQSQFEQFEVIFAPAADLPLVEHYYDNKFLQRKQNAEYWTLIRPELNWYIDPTWVPNPYDPPYIYTFKNDSFSELGIVAEYHVPGATDRKYVDEEVVTNKANPNYWVILKNEAKWIINPNWAPPLYDPPFIYVFGNQWYTAEEMPTAEYRVPGATKKKYVNEKKLTIATNPKHWVILKDDAKWEIDTTWSPPMYDPPYIYVFGNQWYTAEEMATAEYRVPGATDRKYINEQVLRVATDPSNWVILKNEAKWKIDPTWQPNPFEPPYIYVFGNQWYTAEEMPTAEYRVPGATDKKYINEQVLTVELDPANWATLVDNVDVSELAKTWQHNPFEPPYIYVFGNQWYSVEVMPTAEYRVPGATDKKYITDKTALLVPSRNNWTVPEEVNSDAIDFSWVPHPSEPPFVYHFGSEFQISTGLTYTVPGATENKFVKSAPTKKSISKQLAPAASVTQAVSMFFVDMNNKTSAARFEALQLRYPTIQKIRFINGWVETIKRCLTRTKTQKFWVLSSENIYDEFNFEWHAQPWQNSMTHVFGSQWQKWSNTFLINKLEFERHIKWAKQLAEFPNLNFVKDQPVYCPDDIYDIYFVNHYNASSKDNFETLQKRYPDAKVTRYVNNYFDTIKRIMASASTEYVWVVSSLCNYAKFDFTWQPEPWQASMLQVFQSPGQEYGDTFYVHVPSFKSQLDSIKELPSYSTINYCDAQYVDRDPMPCVEYESDSMVDAIKAHTFSTPYVMFKHKNSKCDKLDFVPSVWSNKDKAVHVFSASGSVAVVPRESKSVISAQMYDYPYIVSHENEFFNDKCLDIVYISNGEPDAERWYTHLQSVAGNRTIHRITNVNGRAEAYKAAASISTTPWFFAVFAKLEVDQSFEWEWQPDYMQEPKHYIFNATNPVNGLVYGHQAIIAYNKSLVLDTIDSGLDFTLSKEHASVDMMSGVAHFNVTPLMTWRTSFRECIKLCAATDEMSKERLAIWSTIATGDNAEWSLAGAKDACNYFNEVEGDAEKLKLSFEWRWLNDYFASNHSS